MKPQLFSGQGKLFLALIAATGAVGARQFAGNVTAASLTPSSSEIEHKESTSGKRAVDDTLQTDTKVDFQATFENFAPDIWALALQGSVTEDDGEAVADQPLPAGLEAGDYASLGGVNVSAVTIEDNAGAPLIEGTHYRMESSAHGSIQIINPGTLVQPFKASFTSGASRSFGIMSDGPRRYKVSFEGLNTVTNGKPVLVEFETQLSPARQVNLISDEYGNYEVNGKVFFVDGRFGKITEIG